MKIGLLEFCLYKKISKSIDKEIKQNFCLPIQLKNSDMTTLENFCWDLPVLSVYAA
jgi:hypothetical protein